MIQRAASAVAAVVLTAPFAFGAGSLPTDANFDGAAKPPIYAPAPAPAAPASVPVELAARPIPVPADLAAAKDRVGIAAQLAKLGARRDSESFSFGVIGDAERGRFFWERIFTPGKTAFADQLASLQAAGPDFILQLGDFVSQGDAANYREHVALLDSSVRTPLLRAVGNHDRSRPNGDADKNLYDAVFGPRDYYFDHGGWRFISLDSSDRKVTSAQLAWLAQALAGPQRKIIFTHVPPAYLKGQKGLDLAGVAPRVTAAAAADPDEEDAKEGYIHDLLTNYFKDGSAEFERLVARGNVAAVYMGHIHAFWAADHQGVRYVISGGGGSPLYPLPPGYPQSRFAHYMTVSASPSGLVETVHPYGGGAAFVLPPVRPAAP
jgi:predicted phosphodiesterase